MKTRELRLLIVFVTVITIIGASYAVTMVSFNNTSTIKTGLNIFITQPTLTLPTSCPADGNAAYINTGFTAIAWTLTAGDAGQFVYFCIDNQGSVPDNLGITITNVVCPTGSTPPCFAQGTCPNPTGVQMNYVTSALSTLQPHTTTSAPASVNVCAGGTEALGTGPSFTINVS